MHKLYAVIFSKIYILEENSLEKSALTLESVPCQIALTQRSFECL